MRLCETWWVVIPSIQQVLMIAAGTIGGSAYPRMIQEMDRELNNVIEDFDRVMYVEGLRRADEISEPSFSQSVNN